MNTFNVLSLHRIRNIDTFSVLTFIQAGMDNNKFYADKNGQG